MRRGVFAPFDVPRFDTAEEAIQYTRDMCTEESMPGGRHHSIGMCIDWQELEMGIFPEIQPLGAYTPADLTANRWIDATAEQAEDDQKTGAQAVEAEDESGRDLSCSLPVSPHPVAAEDPAPVPDAPVVAPAPVPIHTPIPVPAPAAAPEPAMTQNERAAKRIAAANPVFSVKKEETSSSEQVN